MNSFYNPVPAFLDTETNTLGDHRMPWEIGFLIDVDGTTVEWGIHIEDYCYEMEPAAAQVNGFDSRFLNDAQYQPFPLKAAVRHLAPLLDHVVFVGSNPTYDQKALANLFLHGGMSPTWHYRSIDVCTLVAGRLKQYVPGLKTAADLMHINYNESDLHSALGDARLSREIYMAVMFGE